MRSLWPERCAFVLVEAERHLGDVRAVLVVGERDEVAVAGAVRDDADLAAVVCHEGVEHPDPG